MTRPLRYVIFTLLFYSLVCVAGGILIADATLHPGRRPLNSQSTSYAENVANTVGSTLQEVSLKTDDQILLQAWLITPARNNGSAVMLLHGMSDNRIGMIGYAEILLSHGYTVLMPDARAHGQSGGAIATYGLLEREDIHGWEHWITTHSHPTCLFGFGESMGAAQLLQSLDDQSLFCAVAAESPFWNFREIGYDRIGQFFHTGPWMGRTILRPLIETAFLYSRWKYKIDLRPVSPGTAVSQTRIPVFLIHGQIDGNIPIRHSRQIKARAPSVVLWEVPHADHCGAISTAPEEFSRRLLSWFSDSRLRGQ